MTFVTYSEEPPFTAEDQFGPGATRETIDGVLVDWVGQRPTVTEIRQRLGTLPTADLVWAEKDRRWSGGFDYDFGDTRGVHHIGTSPKDLDDWNKVTSLANALIQLASITANPSLLAQQIDIYTDSGATTVTPVEWQQILVAAGQFLQPILAGAVALVAMDPIPADYASNEAYWGA